MDRKAFLAGCVTGAGMVIATIVALAMFAPEDVKNDGRTYMG